MGVIVRIAHSVDDYAGYYGAYEDSIRRWGNNVTSQYPWLLFKNVFALAQQYQDNIKLWLAEVNGSIISGALVFYWNQHVVWWHGAAYEEYFEFCGTNVLQAEIIKDAIENGYWYYDFNPSGGHEGVAAFKRRFGASKRAAHYWSYSSPALRLLQGVNRLFGGSGKSLFNLAQAFL